MWSVVIVPRVVGASAPPPVHPADRVTCLIV